MRQVPAQLAAAFTQLMALILSGNLLMPNGSGWERLPRQLQLLHLAGCPGISDRPADLMDRSSLTIQACDNYFRRSRRQQRGERHRDAPG